jgi:hypothetical protein
MSGFLFVTVIIDCLKIKIQMHNIMWKFAIGIIYVKHY